MSLPRYSFFSNDPFSFLNIFHAFRVQIQNVIYFGRSLTCLNNVRSCAKAQSYLPLVLRELPK